MRHALPALGRGWLLACLMAWPLVAAAQDLQPVPALDAPVVDTTGTLDAVDMEQLTRQALELQERKGSQLQVLVVPTTAPEPIEAYTQRVFDAWEIGRKGVDDGVLVVVAKGDRRARIQTGYGLEGAIPDIVAGRIIQEYMAPKFREDDYAGGITDATDVLVKLIDGEALPAPLGGQGDRRAADGMSGWEIALLMGFMVGSIMQGVLRRVSALLRAGLSMAVPAVITWMITSSLLAGLLAAGVALVMGIAGAQRGAFAGGGRGGGWGTGGWGGGSWGGGGSRGGGGWSGGGGRSGGGGASGGW